jgi:hypothetical protein
LVVAFFEERLTAWRQGTREGQQAALIFLSLLSVVLLAIGLLTPFMFPVGMFSIPLVLGALTLGTRPLVALVGVSITCAIVSLLFSSRETSWQYLQTINGTVLLLMAGAVLVVVSRNPSGLPGPLGQAMLMELSERLRFQGEVPPLPDGWRADSVLKSAGGAKFAGDFFIANLDDDEQILELVVVDVSGKGVGAGTKSLQFAGALGGLIGTMSPVELFEAANEFLLRQRWDFSFATAVNLRIDLRKGEYLITTAGHPPVLRWNRVWSTWDIDKAHGMALGIVKDPEFGRSKGTLEPGEALMLYTDGVVESRDRDVDEGIDAMREAATKAVRGGWDGIASRVVEGVPFEDDDRAILVLHRES